MSEELAPLVRWRLVLGDPADQAMGEGGGLQGQAGQMDAALSWLYGRDKGLATSDTRQGGLGPSAMTVPDWINQVNQLFPKETIERLEQDAVERYNIDEMVTNPAVLERVKPSETLLQAVLRTKHLMNPDVLALARKMVAEVVRQLMEKLARQVRKAFSGTLDRRRRSNLKIAKNLDFKYTLRRNLKNYQKDSKQILIEHTYFYSRTKRHTERWQIILLVDQSGSMVGSVIHASVTAACLWALPGMRTHLVPFDTEVVDLSDEASDPVEMLMKVQLGGGTDICKAVQYARDLIEVPRRAIVVCISDFYEGGNSYQLVREVAALNAQGTRFLGLAALDEQANPVFDRELAQQLVQVGAQIGAMTPGELANWIAEKIK